MRIKNPDKRREYLQKYSIQQHFSVEIEEQLELHVFQKGDFLCEERKVPDYLFFILEGKVKLSLLHQDGNVTLVQYYGSGDILGELELLDMRQQSQSIQAVETVVCMALPFDTCKKIVLEDAKFLQTLCRMIGRKMQKSVSKLVNTQSYPLENRLAEYLLQREMDGEKGQWIETKMTDLALYLGVSYRHLSRTMRVFEEAGWIEKERKALRVVNQKALLELTAQMETE